MPNNAFQRASISWLWRRTTRHAALSKFSGYKRSISCASMPNHFHFPDSSHRFAANDSACRWDFDTSLPTPTIGLSAPPSGQMRYLVTVPRLGVIGGIGFVAESWHQAALRLHKRTKAKSQRLTQWEREMEKRERQLK
ncbi:MAG: hypothetical protein OXB95_03890 [Rhodobacteraceae bacterium]|nr:hypothetical protein [Paracoccaceae bacterium]